MDARLTYVADHDVYELTVAGGEELAWFLLEADEARAFVGLVDELDPDLMVLAFADVCGLVRSVTGARPDPEA